jgi:hypothetical protein
MISQLFSVTPMISYKFKINNVIINSNIKVVRVFHHLLEFKMSQVPLVLGIITPTPLKPCDYIRYTYFTPDGKQAIHESVTVRTTEMQSVMKKEDFKNLVGGIGILFFSSSNSISCFKRNGTRLQSRI